MAAEVDPVIAGDAEDVDGVGAAAQNQRWQGESIEIEGHGNGPIDAFTQALSDATGHRIRVMDYHQHAIGAGADARAAAYLELRVDEAHTLFGVGIDADVLAASLKAIVSGLERAYEVQLAVFNPEGGDPGTIGYNVFERGK